MYEFEQYLHIADEYSRHLKRTQPIDSLFYALEASMKLKYFSAMVEPDSGRKYAIKAINTYRRNKLNQHLFPVWIIYANQVSGSRNGMCHKNELGPDKQDRFADTCLWLINKWYPDVTMEKLRIIQANDIRYFDRCGGTLTWVNDYKNAFINYNKLNQSYCFIREQYQKLVGQKHGFISQISYLLALSNLYKREIHLVLDELETAERSNYCSNRNEAIFCLNWRRKLGLSRIESRVYKNDVPNQNELKKAQKAISILKQHEEIHYLRLLHGLINRGKRENDEYMENPFQQLQYYNLIAYKHSYNKSFLEDAWDYCQKSKYTDLNRKRLKDSKRYISNDLLSLANSKLEQLRLMNDSLLLRNNEFMPFLFIEPEVLEERIIKSYSDFKRSLVVVRADDPVAGKYLHGKHSYTIKKTQESLKKTNSGRIEICNLNYEDTLINMMWYLTPDSIYFEINRFKNHDEYLPLKLANEHEKETRNKWEERSFLFYKSYLKRGLDLFREKTIDRITIGHDPNYGSFPVEIFAMDSTDNRWLLNDFAFSYSLGEIPDKARSEEQFIKNNKRILFAVPLLTEKLTDLKYARAQVQNFAKKYAIEVNVGYFSRQDLKNALNEYAIVQLFSHGEKSGKIWLSDGKISSEVIRRLNISAEFVALTTCDSWHGKLYKNEGVGGMVEALEHAGTSKQFASFWKIDEKISVDIMLNFYENLFDGNPPDVSLREAKLNYLNQANKQEVSPIFWGGLAVFGKIEPIEHLQDLDQNNDWLWGVLAAAILIGLLFVTPKKNRSYSRR